MSAKNPEHYQNCTCTECYEECEVCHLAYPAHCECTEEGDEDSHGEPDENWFDGDALASAGRGTDEDYGYFGEE